MQIRRVGAGAGNGDGGGAGGEVQDLAPLVRPQRQQRRAVQAARVVNLKGEHFSPQVKKGDQVRAGDLLAAFDIAGIEAAGYEATTPVVVSNTKKVGDVLPSLLLPGDVAAGDALFAVEPKRPEGDAAAAGSTVVGAE